MDDDALGHLLATRVRAAMPHMELVFADAGAHRLTPVVATPHGWRAVEDGGPRWLGDVGPDLASLVEAMAGVRQHVVSASVGNSAERTVGLRLGAFFGEPDTLTTSSPHHLLVRETPDAGARASALEAALAWVEDTSRIGGPVAALDVVAAMRMVEQASGRAVAEHCTVEVEARTTQAWWRIHGTDAELCGLDRSGTGTGIVHLDAVDMFGLRGARHSASRTRKVLGVIATHHEVNHPLDAMQVLAMSSDDLVRAEVRIASRHRDDVLVLREVLSSAPAPEAGDWGTCVDAVMAMAQAGPR